MQRRTAFFMLILAFGSAANAVEIVLRERCLPAGPVVKLGDLADIGAVGPEELDELSTTPLLPAPAPGSVRHLRAAEIRDLLVLRGIDVGGLRFAGAPLVAIGGDRSARTIHPHTPMATDPAAVKTGLERLATAFLVRESGHPHWRVEIEGNEKLWNELAFAAVDAVVTGGQAPWTGRQKLLVAAGAGQQAHEVFARVIRQDQVVLATRSIERGSLIGVHDVELQIVDRIAPPQAVRATSDVVGKEAASNIAAGVLLMPGAVKAPTAVRRGELVTVTARTAGIIARTVASATQDGAIGDLVVVESGATGKKRRMTARVTGYRELEVFAAPPVASEIALR